MSSKRNIVGILCMLCFLWETGCMNNLKQDLIDHESIKLEDVITETDLLVNEEFVKTNKDLETVYSSHEVEIFETRGDQSLLLEKMESKYWLINEQEIAEDIVISIEDDVTFQEFYGYGAALTHSAASNIYQSKQRNELLTSLFSVENGIALSIVRIPMGASDFVGEVEGKQYHYTYNDLEAGETDLELNQFSIAPDETYIIPILKQIKDINPNVKIIATPWSAPAWMKTSGSLKSGELKPEFYEVYATYFLKYIQSYQEAGLSIDYVSVQNEPHLESSDYPVMYMNATSQAQFIGHYLGPLFEQHNINTKIIGWDHNYMDSNSGQDEDVAKFGVDLLQDEVANKYISGIGFHGYEANGLADFGKGFDKIHDLYPDKELYFTEISGGGWSKDFASNFRWNMQNIMIGLPNHYAQMVLLWNLALDENSGPHLGGCSNCRGVYTTNSNREEVKKEVEYYALGQLSQFVHATSEGNPYRIKVESSHETIDAVGFILPNKEIVVTYFNQSNTAKTINLKWREFSMVYRLRPNTAVTFTWSSYK
ncbi:MAG: glycoside hydrolase family 30 protein [Turicibacter sp.]